MVLMEKSCIHKFLVKLLASVELTSHELSTKSIVISYTFDELLFIEWFEQFRVVGVDVPMAL